MSDINHNNPFKKAQGIQTKRRILSAMSRQIQQMLKMAPMPDVIVNSVLIENYRTEKHQEFKTFKQWRDEGKQVKKGAKAFCVWARPLGYKKNEQGDEEELELDFFPIAHLFSNYQVKKGGE